MISKIIKFNYKDMQDKLSWLAPRVVRRTGHRLKRGRLALAMDKGKVVTVERG
jgi:hypothetical protein